MISYPNVFDWFLREADTLFSSYVRQRLDALAREDIPVRKAIAGQLESYANSKQVLDPEVGPVLLLCAGTYYQIHENGRAEALCDRALHIFYRKNDYLFRAFTYCILYHIHCSRDDTVQTQNAEQNALDCFLHCAVELLGPDEDRATCAYMLTAQDMAADFALSLHGAHRMVYQFKASSFSDSSNRVIREINQAANQNRPEEIQQGIDLLLTTTGHGESVRETFEAYLFSAAIANRCGDRDKAVQYLQTALGYGLPESHEQAFARWMLALLQLTRPGQRPQAINNLEHTLWCIDNLIIDADHKNNLFQKAWYEAFAHAMRHVMNTRLLARVPARP